MLYCSKGICKAVRRYALGDACLSLKIGKISFHIPCIDGVDVFRVHVEYGYEDGRASRRNDYRGDRETFCRPGRRTVCIWDACLCNTCKRRLFHTDHMQNCRHLKIKKASCIKSLNNQFKSLCYWGAVYTSSFPFVNYTRIYSSVRW